MHTHTHTHTHTKCSNDVIHTVLVLYVACVYSNMYNMYNMYTIQVFCCCFRVGICIVQGKVIFVSHAIQTWVAR